MNTCNTVVDIDFGQVYQDDFLESITNFLIAENLSFVNNLVEKGVMSFYFTVPFPVSVNDFF